MPEPPLAGPPRWVKVFVILGVVFVVLFVILHLTGNALGNHLPADGRP